MIQNSDTLKKLEKLVLEKGLTIEAKSLHHFQIKGGAFLVNYYPFSKDKTAYVAATKKGFKGVSPQRAVELALSPPPVMREQVERKQSYRRQKIMLLRSGQNKCKWCGVVLTLETATIEHVIPLKRGGLDHRMNWALACEPCNKARGHDMPEVGAGNLTGSGK